MKKPRLGIVQARPTQFDGPLFRSLAQSGNLEVKVYFTASDAKPIAVDPELGMAPGWDGDIASGYSHIFRSKGLGGGLSFLRAIVNGKHDLVVVAGYTNWVILLAAICLRVRGCPVGMRSDSVLLGRRMNGMKERLKRAILRRGFSWLFRTGHPTGTLARDYLIHCGFQDASLFLFPYNVDGDYLRRQASRVDEIERIRRRFDIAANAFVVLGVVKLIPREDPLTLVRGFLRLARRYPHAILLLVGDGELRDSVEALLRGDASTNVKLAGYVPYAELGYYFGLAGVFVHPALGESWGVSVNEALACGCPAIAADTVGAAADLVVPGVTGFTFRAGDPDALAERLAAIVDDKALRTAMSENARALSLKWTYEQTEACLLSAAAYVGRDRQRQS